MPQANSTTSRPRWMSPLASGSVLPCSEESSAASESHLLCDQLQELEHHARAALRIGRGPGRLRGLRIGDRVLDLGLAGERDLGLDLAGIGIEHVAEAAGRALDRLAADEMADLTHTCSPIEFAWLFACPSRRAGSAHAMAVQIAQRGWPVAKSAHSRLPPAVSLYRHLNARLRLGLHGACRRSGRSMRPRWGSVHGYRNRPRT